jgi:benzodiazapine receptor
MTDSREVSGLIPPVLVLLATITVIAINGFAAAGLIGNVTPSVISGKYPTLVTPAGYAFSIWSMIYIGLTVFSIYQLLPGNRSRFNKLRALFITSCLLNCTWIFLWHYELIPFSLLAIVCLLIALFLINRIFSDSGSLSDFWAVKAPFSIYFGWVTAATLVNATITLKYLAVDFSTGMWTGIGVATILIAAAAGVFIRYRLSNYLYPLAIAWALAAIGVKQSGHTWIVIAAALGTIACLIAALSFVLELPSSGVRELADEK